METTKEWQAISFLSVRIAVEQEKNLKGSGVLYRRNIGEPALVFTAAHVIEPCFAGMSEVSRLFCLDFLDQNGRPWDLKYPMHLAQAGGETEGAIFIHPMYERSTLKNDAAILVIPWQDWMKEVNYLRMAAGTAASSQKGWGYPLSMNREWSIDSRHAGKSNLEGEVIYKEQTRYTLSFTLPVSNPKIDRKVVMEGFSGTGLFEKQNGGLVLAGIISQGAGEMAAGGKLWASDVRLFSDIMQKFGIRAGIPGSMERYKKSALDKINRIRGQARHFFAENAEKLIEDEKLLPQDLVKSEEDFFRELKCDWQRECCDRYWTGQMIRAVFFFAILKKGRAELAQPVIEMPAPYEGERVSTQFLCTEEDEKKTICDLIEYDYFAKGGKLKNGTIFLWNGQNGDLYHDRFPRKECRRIISNIADEYAEYGRRKFVQKTQNLTELPPESQFDIVRGEVQNCNLAFLGMGELERILNRGDGDEKKMLQKMEELLTELWEE